VSLSQIGKFLPNATKEQQAYKEQRQTTLLQQTGQFTMLTQFTKLEDPIAAALAAHGERQIVGGSVSRVCAMGRGLWPLGVRKQPAVLLQSQHVPARSISDLGLWF